MRPREDLRHALAAAAAKLVQDGGGVTWRDMAEAAQVGYLDARRITERMHLAGELQIIGFDKRPHSRRWMRLYAPASPGVQGPPRNQPFARSVESTAYRMEELASATRGWFKP